MHPTDFMTHIFSLSVALSTPSVYLKVNKKKDKKKKKEKKGKGRAIDFCS